MLAGGLASCAASASVATSIVPDSKAEHDTTLNQGQRLSCKYLVAGAGPAGISALTTLQKHASSTDTTLLVAPRATPEYRSAMSRRSDREAEAAGGSRLEMSNGAEIFNVLLDDRIVRVDPIARVATLASGHEVSFDKCILAVGADAITAERKLSKFVDSDARDKAVFLQSADCYRKLDDLIVRVGESVAGEIKPHVTIVGGSWASVCLGALLVKRGVAVTFCFSEPALLARHFPRYISDEFMRRFDWTSYGATDTLHYSALRYITSKLHIPVSEQRDNMQRSEIEVHTSPVFDAYSLMSFRSDFVVFAPTALPAPSLLPEARTDVFGRYISNADLSIYTDIYAAGSCLALSPAIVANDDHGALSPVGSHASNWSSERAAETGHHAALNMLGGREPYKAQLPRAHIDLSAIGVKLHCFGCQDGGAETFGYFLRSKDLQEEKAGGELAAGALFYVQSLKNKLCVTGVVLWEGKSDSTVFERKHFVDFISVIGPGNAKERHEMVKTMESLSRKYLLEEETATRHTGSHPDPASPDGLRPRYSGKYKFATFHRSPRNVPVRGKEVLWIENENIELFAGESTKDRRARAFRELMMKAMK